MADKYTDDDRQAMTKAGQAMSDGSYPIKDAEDLDNAIHAVGRGGADHDAIRKHVIARAKALGLSSKIPDNWNADGSLKGGGSNLAVAPLELRRRRRGSMIRQRERRSRPFTGGAVELRGKPDGTGGTKYEFRGYASVFDRPFGMWDKWGDPFEEVVAPGAFTQTLAGVYGGPDVRFFVGHNDSDLTLARTAHGHWTGTMFLAQDSTGLDVSAPDLDGRSSRVRDLASAVERGDMDGMSIGFLTMGQQWSPDWMQRRMLDLDLHDGDVSVVAIPASPDTAGAVMIPLSSGGGMKSARPAEQRAQDEIIDVGGPPDSNITANGLDAVKCPYAKSNGCGQICPGGSKFCGNCGGPLYQSDGTLVLDDSGVIESVESTGDANLLSMRLRLLELA